MSDNRVVIWTPEETRKNLFQRLQDCFDDRKRLERKWQRTERVVFATDGDDSLGGQGYGPEYMLSGIANIHSYGEETIGINYASKNIRFLHAQMSANPPTVLPRPTSNDPDDRRRADAADRLVRFALREYTMQENFDRVTLNTLIYGTGFCKTIWDASAGDVLEVNEETGEILTEGAFQISIPSVWDMFLDPDANCWEDVRYVFERITLTWEEALYRFPKKKDILKQYRRTQNENTDTATDQSLSAIRRKKYDVVELYEYWEKGAAHNGFLGRFCICTAQGDLITEMKPNPERYAPPVDKKTGKKKIPCAVVPYHILSDLDVPNQVWGKATAEYNNVLQATLNKIDTVTLENMQAHGVARLILPEGSEIADDSITNSPWDIIKITGSQKPDFINPMPMPTIIPELMQRYKSGIDDMSGINESMLGQQSRETSGFSMQYATNQGNMIRRRLFNKYVLLVENVYKAFLRIVRARWDIEHTILVLGKEKAFEATDIKGADIDGGFDLVVEYGASLSLDPTSRREEIITLLPLFEKAGVDTRQILNMLKLNELSGLYDNLELANDRQREIFETMINTGMYIAPEELQDHKNMLAFSYQYVMTTEFKYLQDIDKNLIRRHIKEREQAAAAQAAGAMGAAGPTAGAPEVPQTELPGGPVPPPAAGQGPLIPGQ